MQHSSGPHERPGTAEFHEIDAHELKPGLRLLLPEPEGDAAGANGPAARTAAGDGTGPEDAETAEILEIDTVLDDYGNPALYFAVMDNHINLRVAHGTRVKVSRGKAARPADLLFSGPVPSPAAGAAAPEPDAGSPTADAAPAEADPEAAPSAARPGLEPSTPPAPLRGPAQITLDTGDVVVVPGAAPAGPLGARPDLVARIPVPSEEPEELMARIDSEHPGRHAVNELARRLERGINVKSGACLKDLRDLAYELYVGQADPAAALQVADLLTVLPYDGNPARWSSIESALALAAHLARESGDEDRAAVYSQLLRAPDTVETDPFRAKMAERVRERVLNQPNLYDKEVARAAGAKDHAEERAWRMLRLGSLLHLRAHGGSRAFPADELDRRIDVELDAVRG
ncbi:hypothetical protein GCM10012320_06010 [Sinomonas cellulolyticus]|uniref:Uncharacterized protein n=1 Tax=Sinomonas cellulolyticus TaxID=2801916 RepID=A0ABS1K388_9MICC|nr:MULTISPECIES: DUF6707 family protein [Sinomonas]MBL0705928.1 hypothetical protein [Sinomonas cellulolyticus]GHG42671.1 hypothetical protein GCM10012320_06010 [Sinomonas sp. KCTC 49339]